MPLRCLSSAEIRAVYHQGEAAVVALVEGLQSHIQQLEAHLTHLHIQLEQLQARLQRLEDRLAENSHNSHRPPGSEGLHKPPAPKTLRARSGRPSGGQPGHPGHTLPQVAQPDHVVVHALEQCPCGRCGGRSLRSQPVLDYEKRQVFELPVLRLEVTEHRAEVKCCPVSGQRVVAPFPAGIPVPAQYGLRFQALLVYLQQQQHLPQARLVQLCEDLFQQPLSVATLAAANARTYEHLADFEAAVVKGLQQAPVVHLDESGFRVAARLHWLHVASNREATFYGVHAQRGKVALDAFGIVPECVGWLIHDHWKPYFAYELSPHALCNQHLLRELKFLAEEHQEAWATGLSRLLLRVYRRQQQQGALSEAQFERVLDRYHRWVQQGRERHPPPRDQTRAQSKAGNLLSRLEAYDVNYLSFLLDPQVPFTNNQAEQDLRMLKVRQKISGGFRTLQGAQIFARIRSYLSTCRKQGHNLWQAIQRAVSGEPWLPMISTATL